MGSASTRLQEKFMPVDDNGDTITDGIDTCTQILESGGITVYSGEISVPSGHNWTEEEKDAAKFLIDEWDYDIHKAGQ